MERSEEERESARECAIQTTWSGLSGCRVEHVIYAMGSILRFWIGLELLTDEGLCASKAVRTPQQHGLDVVVFGKQPSHGVDHGPEAGSTRGQAPGFSTLGKQITLSWTKELGSNPERTLPPTAFDPQKSCS